MSKQKHAKKQTAKQHLVPMQVRLFEIGGNGKPWYIEMFPTQIEGAAFLKEYNRMRKAPEKCIAWLRTRPYGTFLPETTEKPI